MRLQGEFRNIFFHLRGVEHSLVEGLVLVSPYTVVSSVAIGIPLVEEHTKVNYYISDRW